MFLLLRTASEMEQVSRMKGALQKSWRGGERAVSWDGRVGRKAAWKTRRSKKQRAQVPATPDSLAGRCHQAQKTLRRARERRERKPHRKKCRRNALEANPEATPKLREKTTAVGISSKIFLENPFHYSRRGLTACGETAKGLTKKWDRLYLPRQNRLEEDRVRASRELATV